MLQHDSIVSKVCHTAKKLPNLGTWFTQLKLSSLTRGRFAY